MNLFLLTETEVEILVNNEDKDITLQHAPTGTKRDINSRDDVGEVDTSNSSLNNDDQACDYDGKAKRSRFEKNQEDVAESMHAIIEEVISSAGDSIIAVGDEDDNVSSGSNFLEDYPFVNTFPDLEVDPDDDEGHGDEDSQDLVNTSTATLKPEFSDLTVKETSELDVILYSDRTSSEFFPDARQYNRDDHSVNFWEAES